MVGHRRAVPAGRSTPAAASPPPAGAQFRPTRDALPATTPSRRQTLVLLLVLLLVAGAATLASVVVRPATARSFALVYGSLFLDDDSNPVAVDLASGRPTVRLSAAAAAVGATRVGDVTVVTLGGHRTLMLDTATGEFNMVDAGGFVMKRGGGGVRVPEPGPASAVPAGGLGTDAFVLRRDTARTAVYLVGPSTVAAAIGSTAPARPRASVTLPVPVPAGPGSAVGVADTLWLLTGAGSAGTAPLRLVQLRVPAGSDAGVALQVLPRGRTSALAALERVTRRSDGSGGSVVAVADASGITLHSGARSTLLRASLPEGTDRVLPVRQAQGRAAFLVHAAGGWSLLSAAADAGTPARVQPLTGVDPQARLAVPAASNGRLYTIDTATGALLQLSGATAGPVPGAPDYPVLAVEPHDLSATVVSAVGSRVVYNDRARYRAEVVFTDGTHPPRVVDKHSGVIIDAATGASALIDGIGGPPGGPSRPAAHVPPAHTPVAPPPQVDPKVNCLTTSQIPHVPAVGLVQRGSRSVQLAWTYPLLDPQDCAPSTYVVSVQLLGGDAPAPPGSVTVQGQTGVDLDGLFPDTLYAITVTAYINGRGTSSSPLQVRTSVEGPAAPTGVHTSVAADGSWRISWHSCGGVAAGCVPAAAWQVVPRFCDGLGVSAPPPTATVVGDPTQHSFSYTYAAGTALLGRSLGFQVEGVGETQVIGTPGSDGGCTRSWTPPVTADLHVAASSPPPLASGADTAATTVSVAFAVGAVHDLGGVGATLAYQLVRSDGTVVDRVGPTTAATATLQGITAGAVYDVVVTATPPGHPEAAVELTAPVVPAVADWPALDVTATFVLTDPTTGTLTVTPTLSSEANRGETFDLTDASVLTCASTQLPLTGQGTDTHGIVSGQRLQFPGIDRYTYRGACTVTVQLAQDPATTTTPPLYGAGPSAPAQTGVNVPDPAPQNDPGNFTAVFTGTNDAPAVAVTYHGPDHLADSRNWTIAVHNGAGDAGHADCGSLSPSQPLDNQDPTVTVPVDTGCVAGAATWTVTVSYTFFLLPQTFTVAVEGTPPTAPVPLDPAQVSFGPGTWDGTVSGGLQAVVHYTGSATPSQLAGVDWTEIVVETDGVSGVTTTCGRATAVPGASAPSVPVDTTACPPTTVGPGGNAVANSYDIQISYTDPQGGSHTWTPSLPAPPP